MGKLDGKVAIVTGASQGIGRGSALALSKEGAHVVLAARSKENLLQTAKQVEGIGRRALAVPCDTRRRDQVEAVVAAAVREFGTVDILVNAAQDTHGNMPLQDWSDEDFSRSLESGLWGTFYFMRACFPLMKEHGGKIINFGSTAGTEGAAGWAGYAAAKEGIRALTRVACHEWGRYKINANVICPLATSGNWDDAAKNNPNILKALLASVPLRRFGDPEADIGRVVVFLASSDSDYMTGQTLMVDGGQAMLR